MATGMVATDIAITATRSPNRRSESEPNHKGPAGPFAFLAWLFCPTKAPRVMVTEVVPALYCRLIVYRFRRVVCSKSPC